MLGELGFEQSGVRFVPVEHHLAHASSAYHLSGFDGKVAILGIDGRGEYATTFFGYGEGGRIHKLAEFYEPDSLGGLYGAITEYLGFEMLDGEFKVMGMAPYGDPQRFDFSRLLRCDGRRLRVNNRLVNVVGLRRYKRGGKGYFFSPNWSTGWARRAQGDAIDEPYIHYAAAVQKLLEDTVLQAGAAPSRSDSGAGRQAGLRRRRGAEREAQPAPDGPAGRAAAVRAAGGGRRRHGHRRGDLRGRRGRRHSPAHAARVPGPGLQHRRVPGRLRRASGPAAVPAPGRHRRQRPPTSWPPATRWPGSRGAWSSARGRSATAASSAIPSHPGVAERINAQIKYRERWRPFCPSVSDRVAADIIGTDHPAPYMTFTFDVAPHWKNAHPGSGARGRHRPRADRQRRQQPALSRAAGRDGRAHRQRRAAEHLAEPPRRADGVLARRTRSTCSSAAISST